jgi:hypothetical protein
MGSARQGEGKRRDPSAMAALSLDALEHRGESLTPVNRRVGCPSEDGVKLIPDGLPFGALARQVEFGQHAFESVDHLGVALKPWIGATFVQEGFNFVHRYDTTQALPIREGY